MWLPGLIAIVFVMAGAAQADTLYWNSITTTGTWTNGNLWSNAPTGGTSGVAPQNSTTADAAVFNQTGTNGTVVALLAADAAIAGLTVNNTGATTIRSSTTTTRAFTIGSSGITINSGAGAFTIGATGSMANVAVAGSQAWTNNSASTFTVNGGITSSASGTQTLTIAGSGATTLAGIIGDGSGVVGITKLGSALLFVSATNTYTGDTNINNGTLAIGNGTTVGRLVGTTRVGVSGGRINNGDATAANNNGITNRINSAAVLTLGGTAFGAGTYLQYAPASGTHSQSLLSLAVRMGANSITASGTTGTNTLTFTDAAATNYTKATGGSVDITTAAGFSLSFSSRPSAAVGTGSDAVLPGATINLNDFVGFSGAGPVVAGTATYVANTWASGSNVNVTANLAPGSAATVNSLRFSTATSSTLTLTGLNPISSGMVLAASSGAASVITGGTLTSGYVNSSSAGELMVYNRSTASTFTINSPIADNGGTSVALTLTGSGVIQPTRTSSLIVLGGTNTYSGPTTLSGAGVQFSDDTAFGAANTLRVTSGGGWLRPSVTSYTWNANRPIELNNGTLSLSTPGTFTVPAVISGSGAVAMGFYASTSWGGLVALTGANTFTGFLEPVNYVQANDGVGLPIAANLRFIGGSTYPGGLVTSGTLTRSIGTGPGQVQWNADPLMGDAANTWGGFSARGGPVLVALGGTASLDTFTWGTAGVAANAGLTLQSIFSDSPLTWVNPINLAGGIRTISNMGNQNAEITGVISNGGLTLNAKTHSSLLGISGTLILSGSNTYSQKTSIRTGFVQVSSINSVVGGSATSNLGAPTTAADGTIDLGSWTTTVTAFQGGLIYTGTGETTDRVINLAASGATTSGIIGGILDQSGVSGTLRFTSAMTVTGSGQQNLTLRGSTAGVGEFAGSIVNGSGTVALTKAGTGRWVLSGSNSYTGVTTISGGVLAVSGVGTLGASGGALTLSGGSLDLGGTTQTEGAVTISAAPASGDTIYGGSLSGTSFSVTNTTGNAIVSANLSLGAAALTKSGAGTLTLSGTNSYSGGTTLSAGVLSISSTAALPGIAAGATNRYTVSAGAALVAGDGVTDAEFNTLRTTGTFSANAAIGFDVGAAGRTYAGTAIANIGSGTALGFMKIGSGTLTMN
ncbi:MAG: autotransporter-associated beta strand repeat-containing protein, partial [Pirellulales bacterium]